jgi:hypothetical protein
MLPGWLPSALDSTVPGAGDFRVFAFHTDAGTATPVLLLPLFLARTKVGPSVL